MTRYTAPTLSTLDPAAPVRIACRRCDRRGRYRLATLMARYGDALLPEVLRFLARDCGCPNHDGHWGARCSPYFLDRQPTEKMGPSDDR